MNSFDLCVIDLEESLDKLKNFRNKFNSTISTKSRNLEQCQWRCKIPHLWRFKIAPPT